MNQFPARLLLFACLFVPVLGSACPFCGLVTGSTLRSELTASVTVILCAYDYGQYRVLRIIKGDSTVPVGGSVRLAGSDTHPQHSQHLLMMKKEKPGLWEYWDSSSKARFDFAVGMLKLPPISREGSAETRLTRLRYFYPYLVSEDSQLMGSALEEFAASPYSIVKEMAQELDRAELREWITSKERTSSDRRFFFTLLAASRHEEDIPFVKAAVDKNLNVGMSVELDAILAAYLTLTGETGLKELDRGLLSAATSASSPWSPSVYRAVAEALRFHMDQETVIDQHRLLESCRLLLAFPGAADHIIEDFARWEDWESLESILTLWELSEQKRWLKRPILNYLQACPLPEAKAALPEEYRLPVVTAPGSVVSIEWSALRPSSPGEQTMLNLTLEQEIDVNIIKKSLQDRGELSKQVKAVERRLRAKGIDARKLLAPITTADLLTADPYQMREPVDFWNGQRVELAGYPVALHSGQSAEYLLVPMKGACVELPSPPPNQVVHVTLAEAESLEPGEKATFTGTLRIEKHAATLMLNDAERLVSTAYRMEDVNVNRLQTHSTGSGTTEKMSGMKQ